MRAVLAFTFMIICAMIAWIDIQKQKIYNGAVAALFVPAIVSFFVFPEMQVMSRVWGALSVSGIMLLTSLVVPEAFGGGDIKMMVPVGLFLGLERTLVAGMLALTAGLVWYLVNLGKIKRFAFGPALCIGSITAFFCGQYIWQWLI